MSHVVDKILSDDLDEARKEIHEILESITNCLIYEAKCRMSHSLFTEGRKYKSAVRRVGRLNLVRVRVRRGKVQRRKKVSAVKGWTFRRNRMTRMRPSERMRRRLSARRAKIKRRAKMGTIRRKTAISMRKRRSLGLSYRPFGR